MIAFTVFTKLIEETSEQKIINSIKPECHDHKEPISRIRNECPGILGRGREIIKKKRQKK